MLNLDTVETVYIACGFTDLRKSIDGVIYLFENLVNVDLACSESLEKLMSWSSTLPATLRIKEKK